MTVQADISLAPGCFGSPIIFKEASVICSACMFMGQCAPRSSARRAALHEHFGITPKPVKLKLPKPEPIFYEDTMVSKKVSELLDRFEKAGITVTDTLARGENPFKTKPMFMRLACHLLLRISRGITREQLVTAFVTKLNWSEGTATAHASQSIQALTALGAVTEINGRIILKRT